MTGENFKRIERGTIVKELKEKILELEHQCGEMCNINNIRENGFDSVKYHRLSKKIEWYKYLLWGYTEK